ncbi:MAG: hypothetical protein IJ083_05490 [Clostridia bacterium]|nr:hypothetical protein [Clostridia bacterium]
MGTFIGETGKLTIPEERWPDFLREAMLVLREGGMFACRDCNAWGKAIWLLVNPRPDEHECVDVSYNSFEHSVWENAGIDLKDHYVYSGKVGWSQFNMATAALYYLAEIYSTTPYATSNHSRSDQVRAIQWLRYVTGRELHYTWRKYLWDLLELRMEDRDEPSGWVERRWITENLADEVIAPQYVDILFALRLVDEFMASKDREQDNEGVEDSEITYEHAMYLLIDGIRALRASSDLSEEEQVRFLLHIIIDIDGRKEEYQVLLEKYRNMILGISMLPCQASVKIVAVTYGKKFWPLWRSVQEDARKKEASLGEYAQRTDVIVPYREMSTEEFFGVDAWERLYWWKEDGDVVLTEEILSWLDRLKLRFETLMAEPLEGGFDRWQERFVDLLTRQNEMCYEELFWEFMGSFREQPVCTAVRLLEEADGENREFRHLLDVLGNRELRQRTFGF